MINEERLLKVLKAPHVSEKTQMLSEKNNTIVFKVLIDSTKKEIKAAVEKLFEVEVDSINTLIIKGKTKRQRQSARQGRRSDIKKAYVTLKAGSKLDFMSSGVAE